PGDMSAGDCRRPRRRQAGYNPDGQTRASSCSFRLVCTEDARPVSIGRRSSLYTSEQIEVLLLVQCSREWERSGKLVQNAEIEDYHGPLRGGECLNRTVVPDRGKDSAHYRRLAPI